MRNNLGDSSMNVSFERITFLEYRLKAAMTEIMAFKSGRKYVEMQEKHTKEMRFLERKNKKLKMELSKAYQAAIKVRRQWFEVFEDIESEHAKEMAAANQLIEQLEDRALQAEHQRDTAQDKVTEQRHHIYKVETALEEERGRNLQLTAQLSKDFENSSLPSSAQTAKRKKIPNNREVSGKHPGGQAGHAGHCRKKQVPTYPPVLLKPMPEIADDPDFMKTKQTIVKQLVNIRMMLEVTEYQADVYRNYKTGETYHAEFPAGVVDEVNYGGSIKAFLFLLNNECCTSIDKSRKFLSDLTGGKLNISKGMVNKLSKKFAEKSGRYQKEAFSELLLSPVMHTDCTNARVNGKSAYVFICAAPDGQALYIARRKKGHEGVKGTPAEYYQGILVHDHEKTFYNYGSNHQECLAHVQRCLKGSIENESDRVWNKKMHSLLQEMIHYRNGLDAEEECNAAKVREYEARYCEILQKAKEEYEYIPCSEYYKEGYNLSVRMEEYMENHLLFLHDRRVPTTNNTSERLLRSYKRKQKQAMSFRSYDNIDYLCQSMSMLLMMRRKEDDSLFERVSQMFE